MDRLRRRHVFAPDGFPAAGEVVVLDSAVEVHTHDFLEVAVLLGGTVTHLSQAGRETLSLGAVTAVRPGQWHGYTDPDGAVIGNLYLGAEVLHGELRWLLDIGDLSRFLLRGGLSGGRLDPRSPDVVGKRLGELADTRARPGPAGAVQAVRLSIAVLGELARIGLDRSAETSP